MSETTNCHNSPTLKDTLQGPSPFRVYSLGTTALRKCTGINLCLPLILFSM